MREVKPLSFVYEIPDALPGDVCREIIRRFEEKADQPCAGRIGQALREAVKQFPFLAVNRFKDLVYNLQRSRSGEYYRWHVDSRQLVALWYLNNVETGGETEFDLQQVRVKPVEGKLVLFPPFWRHIHRAVRCNRREVHRHDAGLLCLT